MGEISTCELFMGGGAYSKFLPLNFHHSRNINRHKIVAGGVWSAKAKLAKIVL